MHVFDHCDVPDPHQLCYAINHIMVYLSRYPGPKKKGYCGLGDLVRFAYEGTGYDMTWQHYLRIGAMYILFSLCIRRMMG